MTNRNDRIDHDDPYTPDEDDPDWEFSEARGYSDWEPPKRDWMRPLMMAVSLRVLAGMAAPVLLSLFAHR